MILKNGTTGCSTLVSKLVNIKHDLLSSFFQKKIPTYRPLVDIRQYQKPLVESYSNFLNSIFAPRLSMFHQDSFEIEIFEMKQPDERKKNPEILHYCVWKGESFLVFFCVVIPKRLSFMGF